MLHAVFALALLHNQSVEAQAYQFLKEGYPVDAFDQSIELRRADSNQCKLPICTHVDQLCIDAAAPKHTQRRETYGGLKLAAGLIRMRSNAANCLLTRDSCGFRAETCRKYRFQN
jgi:hypothetical protein